jgi:Sulfotransferase family
VSAAPQPILVTGSHRSGTTWVGRVLAFSPTPLGYIWEPFSPRHRPGTFPIRFPHYFHYLCAENGATRAGPIADMLAFRYRPAAELRSLRSARDAGRMARDWSLFARSRRRGAAPLMKDPIALFSSEWLADTFDMRVLVMIRHPASFAASIRRRGWRHRFADFLDQPLLMRDFLAPYEGEIREADEREPDLLDEAILLWKVLYGSAARMQERRGDWLYVRLEDLAHEPVAGFRDLYSQLGLEWTASVEQRMLETSAASNPADSERVDSIRRNSAAHVTAWKAHLTAAEIERVRRGTEPLASRWYGDGDW